MENPKKALKDEVAVMHTNCGTYCNPEAENENGTFTLYRCVNCHRAFMLGEFADEPANSVQPTDETPSGETPSEPLQDAESPPPRPRRQKKSE